MRGAACQLHPRALRPVRPCGLRHRRRWPIRPVHHQLTPWPTRAIGFSGSRRSPRIGYLRRPSGKIAVRVRRSRNRQELPPCSDGRRMGIPYHDSPFSGEPAVHSHVVPVSVGKGQSVELSRRPAACPSDRTPSTPMIGASSRNAPWRRLSTPSLLARLRGSVTGFAILDATRAEVERSRLVKFRYHRRWQLRLVGSGGVKGTAGIPGLLGNAGDYCLYALVIRTRRLAAFHAVMPPRYQ